MALRYGFGSPIDSALARGLQSSPGVSASPGPTTSPGRTTVTWSNTIRPANVTEEMLSRPVVNRAQLVEAVPRSSISSASADTAGAVASTSMSNASPADRASLAQAAAMQSQKTSVSPGVLGGGGVPASGDGFTPKIEASTAKSGFIGLALFGVGALLLHKVLSKGGRHGASVRTGST